MDGYRLLAGLTQIEDEPAANGANADASVTIYPQMRFRLLSWCFRGKKEI